MWYESIADLYDGLVQFDDDVPFFLEYCRRAGGPVIELMAGTGRLSIPLIEAGVDLTCVDLSEAMLQQLRTKLARRGLCATVLRGDVRDLPPGGNFSLGVLAFNGLSELVDANDRRKVLHGVYSVLAEGGGFVCTLHNPTVRLARLEDAGVEERCFPHPSGRGSVRFAIRCDYDPATRIAEGVQRFDRLSPEGELAERREVDVRFCIPTRHDFENMAQEAGFVIESLYGDYDWSDYRERTSPFMIWMLRK